MTRTEFKDGHCTTYTYNVKDILKKEVLGAICDILHDNDITGHGIILTQPVGEKDWPGTTKEIPFNPDREAFSTAFAETPLTWVTAIMEYHGMSMMISYMPDDALLSVILPNDFEADIDEVEKNVIPDIIDQNPAE